MLGNDFRFELSVAVTRNRYIYFFAVCLNFFTAMPIAAVTAVVAIGRVFFVPEMSIHLAFHCPFN